MRFKNFEIRQYKNIDGTFVDGKYELVKWEDASCFVVAFIEYDAYERYWNFQSVGLRYLEHCVDDLNYFVLKYLDVLRLVEMDKHENK